jgi:outer membrane protein OmpA-like peptidoglycan-associated protein
LIGTIKIKSDGSFIASLVVPVGLPLGSHTLVLQSIGDDLKVQSEQFPVTLQAQVDHKFNVVFSPQKAQITRATNAKLTTFANALARMVNVSITATCFVNPASTKTQNAKVCAARVAQIKKDLKARNVVATFKKSTTAKATRPSSAQTVRLSISAISH